MNKQFFTVDQINNGFFEEYFGDKENLSTFDSTNEKEFVTRQISKHFYFCKDDRYKAPHSFRLFLSKEFLTSIPKLEEDKFCLFYQFSNHSNFGSANHGRNCSNVSPYKFININDTDASKYNFRNFSDIFSKGEFGLEPSIINTTAYGVEINLSFVDDGDEKEEKKYLFTKDDAIKIAKMAFLQMKNYDVDNFDFKTEWSNILKGSNSTNDLNKSKILNVDSRNGNGDKQNGQSNYTITGGKDSAGVNNIRLEMTKPKHDQKQPDVVGSFDVGCCGGGKGCFIF